MGEFEYTIDYLFFLAVTLEEKSVHFYKTLKNNVGKINASDIDFLIEEEKKHLEFFTSCVKKRNLEEIKDIDFLDAIDKQAKVFIPKQIGDIHSIKHHEDIYKVALALEESSINIFNHLLPLLDNNEEISVLKNIVDEEYSHKKKIEIIMVY
jgi:rubrerythrin